MKTFLRAFFNPFDMEESDFYTNHNKIKYSYVFREPFYVFP